MNAEHVLNKCDQFRGVKKVLVHDVQFGSAIMCFWEPRAYQTSTGWLGLCCAKALKYATASAGVRTCFEPFKKASGMRYTCCMLMGFARVILHTPPLQAANPIRFGLGFHPRLKALRIQNCHRIQGLLVDRGDLSRMRPAHPPQS